MLCEYPEMAKYVVAPAFEEQLLGVKTSLLDTLLQKAPYAITWEKLYLYGGDICGVSGKEHKERNYNLLARILCHRLDLAKYFVYSAYQEQASGCESCLLPTLLRVAPETITQENFDDYIDTVHTMRPIVYANSEIITSRPSLVFSRPGPISLESRKRKKLP